MKDKWWGFYTQLSEGECCKPGASTKCGPATYFGPWSFVQNKIIKGHNVFKCKYKSFTTEKQADEFMRYGPAGKQNSDDVESGKKRLYHNDSKVLIDWSQKPEVTETGAKKVLLDLTKITAASLNEKKRQNEVKSAEYIANEAKKITIDWSEVRANEKKRKQEIKHAEYIASGNNRITIDWSRANPKSLQNRRIEADKAKKRKAAEETEQVTLETIVPQKPEIELLKQKIAYMKVNQIRLEDENQKLTKTIQKLKNAEPKITKITEPTLIIQEEGRSLPATPPATDEELEHLKQTTIDKLVCYAYAFNATNQNGGFGLFFPDHKTFTTSQPVDRLKLQCDDMTQLKWKGEFSTLEAIHQALMLAKRVGAKSVLLKLRNDMSEKHLTKLWLSEVWKGEDWQRKFETSLSNKILGLMGVIATEFEVVEAEKEVDLLDIADQLAVVGSAMSFV